MSKKGLPPGTHYTAEMFQTETSPHAKGRVLTLDEVKMREKTVVNHAFVGRDQNVIFYSDNHLFGYPILPEACVPTTITIPRRVAARPTFEDGIICTAADEIRFEQYCNPNLRILQSMDELVDYLNSNY